jgi:hypothetical protein
MPTPGYPQMTITPNLGLSLTGMDEVIAEDMILIDTFAGTNTPTLINAQSSPGTAFAGNVTPFLVTFPDPFPNDTYTVTLSVELDASTLDPGLVYVGGFIKDPDNQDITVYVTNNADVNVTVIVHAIATQLPS